MCLLTSLQKHKANLTKPNEETNTIIGWDFFKTHLSQQHILEVLNMVNKFNLIYMKKHLSTKLDQQRAEYIVSYPSSSQ